ncbi:MAG: helix-turn-helix transcriptional regulator [Pseudomonadales bacterium]|nr:helix-turn-helix transcriptional regulator [Pseudomonadales bacterium]
MTSSLARQASPEFADLLRGWRKSRKLSQWNLALDAGISQRHLSFLESGRSAPSREMVMLLAGTLELPLREQNAMLNAAGFAGVFPERSIDATELAHARKALSMMIERTAYPALVVDRNWHIMMANDATVRVFSALVDMEKLWTDIGGGAPNILRATLHPKGFRPFIRNWREFASWFLHQLTQELAMNPYDFEARALLDEIRGYPDMPDANPVAGGGRSWLGLEIELGERRLEFFSMISTFGTPLDVTLQEIRIETFFPADTPTEKWLAELASA